MSGCRAHGFTLIEVLLATVLLAAGLALAFATLRSATQMAGRGEALAARNERMRAVEGFLRKRIGSAQPIVFETEADTQRGLRFLGDARRMRFVADLPDYLGRGGPYLHDLGVGDDGSLHVGFAMVLAGKTIDESATRGTEVLAEGLRAVRFRYRGIDSGGGLGKWSERWDTAESLPAQVRVEIESADGTRWPPLVVGLAYGDGGQGALAGGVVQ